MIGALMFFGACLFGGLIFTLVLLAYMVNFLFILMPILFVGCLVSLWYFIKMKPDKSFANYAKIGATVGAIGLALSIVLNIGMFRSPRIEDPTYSYYGMETRDITFDTSELS